MAVRRRYWVVAASLIAIVVAGLGLLAIRIPLTSETLRSRVTATLADRLDSDVRLGALSLRLLPTIHVEGHDLVIHHRGRHDVPPLISVTRFTISTSLLRMWNKDVEHVKLEGLTIQIPPGDDKDRPSGGTHGGEEWLPREHYGSGKQVVIQTLEASDATIVILRREPGKTPRTWELHSLRARNLSGNTPMSFQATLTNAVPPGRIETDGSFGPWHRDEPGHTPIFGRFVFNDADLSVFKGIAGTLSAHGTYGGTLERLDVDGETDTPAFVVKVGGQPVPLKTKYEAIVDATNGNTTLERIDAQFLNTSLVAKGGVYEVDGVKGRRVVLDIDMPSARLEDIMRLAVPTPAPPMTGALALKTAFEIPPGDIDIVDKLRLDGRFAIENGRFTNREVQNKINELSKRASGRKRQPEKKPLPVNAATPPVASDFTGRFRLRSGMLELPSLVFDVPGAVVDVKGRYALRRESLDFGGQLVMDAKVSEAMTGWKSILLKVVDPLFRKEGKTVVPIKIQGTRNEPKFGINFGELF
jgi:hypothetical protein